MNLRISAAFALIAVTFIHALPAYAGKSRTRIEYFYVSGTTTRELHNNIKVPRGLFSFAKDAYADISMIPEIRGRYVSGKNCRIKGFRIDAGYVIRLPRLRGGTRLKRRLSKRFNSFVAYLKRHEHTHRKIFQGCIARVERQARNIRAKNCDLAKRRFSAMYSRETARCIKLNQRFDSAERRTVRRQSLVRTLIKPKRRARRHTRRTARKSARRN